MREASVATRMGVWLLERSPLPFRVLSMAGYKELSQEVYEVARPSIYEINAPFTHGETLKSQQGQAPSLLLRKFTDAEACSDSSAFLLSNRIAIPDHYHTSQNRNLADGRRLLWHGQDSVGIVQSGHNASHRQEGIALFGTGTMNWYHWLIISTYCILG